MYDVETLPLWAQSKIKVLKGDVAYHKARVDKAEAGDSEVWLQGSALDPETALPPDSRITFRLGPERRSWITVSVTDEGLEIFGNDTLTIEPKVTNRIVVR